MSNSLVSYTALLFEYKHSVTLRDGNRTHKFKFGFGSVTVKVRFGSGSLVLQFEFGSVWSIYFV